MSPGLMLVCIPPGLTAGHVWNLPLLHQLVYIGRRPSFSFELLRACVAGKKADDYVFIRDNGERVKDFRGTWAQVCANADVHDLFFHDLRRTGARNLRRLGVSEGVIMRIGGWKTRNVFERYNIVDQADLADAARRLDQKRETQDFGHSLATVEPNLMPEKKVGNVQ
jgi:integrase